MDARRDRPRVFSNKKLEARSESCKFFKKIGVDALTAGTAAMVVSPIMTVIDRAVIEAAAGQRSVIQSMKVSLSNMVRQPIRLMYNRPFQLMLMLYGGTYFTANALDTASSCNQDLPASTTTSTWSKFGTVSAVNVGLSLYKDSQFARVFGQNSAQTMTVGSFVPFVIRDGMTIFATFNLPQLLVSSLPEPIDTVASRLSIAQFMLPAAMQLFATPLHLVGLDIYNRPNQSQWRNRIHMIRANWIPASVARMCRIVPAYGLGGVVNTSMRRQLMERLL